MATQNRQDAAPKRKRPQKIFGVMTKRRWFGVVVFLSAMLWSYTAGPPLEDSIVCNQYFLDGTAYDYKTVAFEGDIQLIDTLFRRGRVPPPFHVAFSLFDRVVVDQVSGRMCLRGKSAPILDGQKVQCGVTSTVNSIFPILSSINYFHGRPSMAYKSNWRMVGTANSPI